MQKACSVLLAAFALCLAGNIEAVTILPNEVVVPYSEAVVRQPNEPPSTTTEFIIGKMDTVGGTTYDWAANGPCLRMIANSPGNGIHVVWMYSASTSGTAFPDRNMRYNFYDYSMRAWNWIDPDYMTSGVNVFTDRSGYGGLANNRSTGVAWVSRHYGTTLTVGLARDLAPGGGIFEYCAGPVCLWPSFDFSQNGWVQIAVADANPQTTLMYTRSETWCNIPSPTSVTSQDFPTYSIAASKVSMKVAMTWVPSTGPTGGYYRTSNDGGVTWGLTQSLAAPPAYGGDTTASFHITGLFPFYDKYDRLHLTGAVMPYVAGSGYVIPADIWHWSPDNSPNWSRIHRATCNPANLRAPVGYNAIFACRPTMGQDQYGNLYVAWEQFDSANYQTSTNRVRAEIWYSRSTDNGKTWAPGTRITDLNTTSKRFPSIIDVLDGDTLYITYIQDQIAGFFVQNEGGATNNPIIVHKVPVTMVGAEERKTWVWVEELSVQPNPCAGRVQITYALPTAGRVQLAVLDLAGREVARLRDEYETAGRYSTNWHAADLPPGVYIARLRAGGRVLTQKLVLQ